MKPLEILFFQCCYFIKTKYTIQSETMTHYEIALVVDIFCNYGFSYKQLMYYLSKWYRKGFYEYGVGLSYGWFIEKEIPYEYRVLISNNIK